MDSSHDSNTQSERGNSILNVPSSQLDNGRPSTVSGVLVGVVSGGIEVEGEGGADGERGFDKVPICGGSDIVNRNSVPGGVETVTRSFFHVFSLPFAPSINQHSTSNYINSGKEK